MSDDHDWLTLHRVKFTGEIDGRNNPRPPPDNAHIWRFAPQSPIGQDGLFTGKADVWGGFAAYSTKAEAEAVFDDPMSHLPFLADADEAWHAIVIPYAHRGGVRWRDNVQQDSAISIASSDPKGPLVIMTSAGYTNPGPEDQDRIKEFTAGIDAVINFYGTLPGNLRRGIFSGAVVDGREGCTITLWQDDKSMLSAAYKSGVHKEQLARHTNSPLFDRSSFTRGRIIASKGNWDGANPIDELLDQPLD